MERNTVIAIVLSVLIILGYQYFFTRQAPVKQPAQQPRTEAPAPAQPPVAEPAAPVEAAPAPSPAAAPEEKLVTVETELYRATLSSTGGTVKEWLLKKYKDQNGNDVSLLEGQGPYRALAVGFDDDFGVSDANFSVRGGDLNLRGEGNTGSVVFEYRARNYSIKRTYTFYSDKYLFDLTDEVTGLPSYEITLGGYFGIHNFKEDRLSHTGPVLLQGTDRREFKAKKLEAIEVYRDPLKWIAEEDKYFFAAIVPETPMQEARVWKAQDTAVIAFQGAAGENRMRLYAGPKSLDRLKALGLGLQHIVDFGFFSVIARPIFWLLQMFHGVVGNYGWAIVILTIVIRVPFIPLVNKGQRSMKKLQQLQPRMQELKEKYKNDSSRMQQEMMQLYKKYKVNPLGGCLPMILQIPVFFALYKVLLITIELRDAPWVLWIRDLSQKDPLYILPVVMGVTMLIQQKMTPSAGDPRQQKLMMFMPVVFTFLFLSFPAGLVLYWLVNNLLSIAQQIYVNRKKEA
jgi:YidC/Oxa1 family membrane protein insertase